MDESLKARLIGAAVLVVLAVLLIPELLSGRKAPGPVPADADSARGTRTFTIELGGTPAEPARAVPSGPTAPAPASATTGSPPAASTASPAPAEAVPADAPPASARVPVVASAPDEKVAADVPPAQAAARPQPESAAAAPASGGWVVQVGAFGSPDTARKLVKELQGDGYRAFESPIVKAGKTLHRVRVGPEPERAGAERLAERLKARGLPSTIVRNE